MYLRGDKFDYFLPCPSFQSVVTSQNAILVLKTLCLFHETNVIIFCRLPPLSMSSHPKMRSLFRGVCVSPWRPKGSFSVSSLLSACPHIPICDPCFEEFLSLPGDNCCPNQGKCVKLNRTECGEGEATPDANGKCASCLKPVQRPLSSNPQCKQTFTCCARGKRFRIVIMSLKTRLNIALSYYY